MRVSDLAAPAIPVHVIPPDQPSAKWPAAPVIGLEWVPQSTWNSPDPASVWDNPAPLVWDDPASLVGMTDVWCDTAGLEVVHGEPDEVDLYPPSRATLTLYDPTGRYRRRTVDGQLVYYAPGRRLSCLCRFDAGDLWWLFNGRVAEWHELGDDLVEVVAYAAPSNLAQDPGRDWTAGVAGDTIRPRVNAIVAASGVVGVTVRADVGTATLSVPAADRVTPWDALQRATWSDAGVVYSDADDTLVARDRAWRTGRADTPTPPLVVTDNVCIAGNTVVWDLAAANVDDWLAGRVVLSNDADPALIATASNPAETVDPNLVFTHPDRDLWRTQAEGNSVAAAIANDRGTARQAIALARVLLHDPRRQTVADWRPVIDLRLGDRIGWQHETDNVDGTVSLVDVDVIASTVRHLITPETWTVEIESTPAVGYRVVHEWDSTTLTWDTADLTGVWR